MFIDMSTYLVIGIFFVGILNSFVDKRTITRHMGKNNFSSVVKASIIGVPLPLCSCGVVPTAIQLKKDGGSNGSVVSFLVSTPQTGVDSIIATYGMMGPIMAVYRPLAAFISGVISGLFVNLFSKDKDIIKQDLSENKDSIENTECIFENSEVKSEDKFIKSHSHCESSSTCCNNGHNHDEMETKSFREKFIGIFTYGFGEFLEEISTHFILGVLISALISTLIPDNFFIDIGLNNGMLSMVIMVVVGIPMYICSTSSIPIALSLILKGLSPGAAFVFLFAGPVTNMASLIVIKNSLKKEIMAIYVSSTIIMSIIFGLIFDFIASSMNIDYTMYALRIQGGDTVSLISYIFAFILLVVLAKISIKKLNSRKNSTK